jgi:hypothetical protein
MEWLWTSQSIDQKKNHWLVVNAMEDGENEENEENEKNDQDDNVEDLNEETLDMKDVEAMEEREEDWTIYRRERTALHEGSYDAFRTHITSDVAAGLSEFVPLPELRTLIVTYVLDSKQFYVSRMHLHDLLSPPHDKREEWINSLPDNEIVVIESMLSEHDPGDYSVGDCQFSDSSWQLSKDRRKQRFIPVERPCEGCQKRLWVAVDHKNGHYTSGILRFNLSNVHWLKSHSFPMADLSFLCTDCKTMCACGPRPISFYQRWCRVCERMRCDLHDFKKSPPRTDRIHMFDSSADRDCCDRCLKTLQLGKEFSNILVQPQPLTAFNNYLATSTIQHPPPPPPPPPPLLL